MSLCHDVWICHQQTWRALGVITRPDHRTHQAGRSGNVVRVLWWKWILSPHPRPQWPGVGISIGRVAGPGVPAECGPLSLLQFSGHCPSSVWAGQGVGHWPARAQPSPAQPTLAHLAPLQINPGHRDTDFPYATKNIEKNINLSFIRFILG